METNSEHIIQTYGIAKDIIAGKIAWIDQRFIDSDSRSEHIQLGEVRRYLIATLEQISQAEANDSRLKPLVDNFAEHPDGAIKF